MKMLVAALSLLVVAVASAHHSPNHRLTTPEFIPTKTHIYDVTINVTSGVPGVHPQVSKSVVTMELEIYAETKTELVLRAQKVLVSQSLSAVGSPTDKVTLRRSSELEEKLKIPIKATYENGKIKSFTLDSKDDVLSSKIKRTILRNFEVYMEDRPANLKDDKYWSPLSYNTTKSTPFGNYSSNYVIMSSPDAAFPYEKNVYNITQTDDYDGMSYMSVRSHHNFQRQGCPQACTSNLTDSAYAPGCPSQMEPHKTPLRKSFYRKHNIKMSREGINIHDTILTTEKHIADLYDQNMEIVVKTVIQYKKATSKEIPSVEGQTSYNELNDWSVEVQEKEISEKCGYPDPRKAITSSTHLLEQLASVVMEGKTESPKAKRLGEDVILLQKALSVLKEGDLRNIQRSVVSYDELPTAKEEDKVKRQIWLNILPLIGTEESVSFIVKLISENVNKPNPAISLWESKTILEALPMNIVEPTETTITELSSLLDIISNPETPGYSMFYSASHLAVARVIRGLCSVNTGLPETSSEGPSRNFQRTEMLQRRRGVNPPTTLYQKKCPKTIVKKFISDVTEHLKSTSENTKRIIYIQTLATTGQYDVLKTLKPYVYGQMSGLSQNYMDYVRNVAINALFSIAPTHPKMVQDILVPVFFNKTEAPKIRVASFAVIMKSQPTLGLLQTIAVESWSEPSQEVGSYITSTMETFGNSTIPCDQTTARRIKKVLPQMKRNVPGNHHAQNILKTMFDSVRGFGAQSHLAFVPSNESFIPSHIYGSFGAHIDSFKDMLFSFAATSQGFTSRNIWDALLMAMNQSPAEDIPKNKESHIFQDTDILSRDPEFWRIAVFDQLFYSQSYYYYDEETKKTEYYDLLKDQISHYFKMDLRSGQMEGHIVRLYIPSSYQSKAISHAFPSTIEFEMRSPLLLSFKVKAEIEKKSSAYALDIVPSVYYSTVYTHHFLNLEDCKDIGVYHEKKMAAVYPMHLTLSMGKNITITYKFHELPKTVLTYTSEAGTYSGKKTLTSLPFLEDRKVYKTIPSQFRRSDTFGVPAFPSFSAQVLTEDMHMGYEEVPRDSEEALALAIRNVLNAGWRRKSLIVKRVPGSSSWTQDTEVKISFGGDRKYVVSPAPSSDESPEAQTSGLSFEESPEHPTHSDAYTEEAESIARKLHIYSHIRDALYMSMEQTSRGKTIVKAGINATYRRTLGGNLHLLTLNSTCKVKKAGPTFGAHHHHKMSGSYAMAFSHRPNEFNYKQESFGKQKGIAIALLSFPKAPSHIRPAIALRTIFHYSPLENMLAHQMTHTPTREQLAPETHKECLSDVSSGKAQSVACIKAVREAAIFNKFKTNIVWDKDLPYPVMAVAHQLDLALKHAFYSHIHSEVRPHPLSHRSMTVEVNYINKMTDKPVFNIHLHKPTEVLRFNRVKAGVVQPLSSIDGVLESYVARYTNNTYPASCGLMGSYVRTYDLKTYKLPKEDMESCTYVLSTHCTDKKKFAIMATIDPQTREGAKDISVYLGSEEYTLTPGSRSGWKVKQNGSEHVIKTHQSVLLNKESSIYAYVHHTADGSSYLEFQAKKAGIKVTYDGKNVKVVVHPRYKGELCGLCSEFNGEIVREMRGIDKCLYSHSYDFVKSNIVGSKCNKEPTYKRICNNDDQTFAPNEPEHRQNGYVPTMKRNMVLSRGNRFCFSVKPMSMCEDGSPAETERQEVEFHCLPKTDKEARKYVKDARSRILGEMTHKPVNHKESVEIHSMC